MYLGVAEEDRLNALNPPEKTPELFERFLPYAVALDVENRWAERFAGVLAAAGAGAAVGSWYAGNDNWANDRSALPVISAAICRRRSRRHRPRPARATGAAAVVAAVLPAVVAAEAAGRVGSDTRAYAGFARKVMRAWLWPIFVGARRAENPAFASFSMIADSS